MKNIEQINEEIKLKREESKKHKQVLGALSNNARTVANTSESSTRRLSDILNENKETMTKMKDEGLPVSNLKDMPSPSLEFKIPAIEGLNYCLGEIVNKLNEVIDKTESANVQYTKDLLEIVTDKISSIKIEAPEIKLPVINIPEIKIPTINVPQARLFMPKINVPEAKLNIPAPKVTIQAPAPTTITDELPESVEYKRDKYGNVTEVIETRKDKIITLQINSNKLIYKVRKR